LRIVAEHADIWNVIGPPRTTVEQLAARSRVLDELCAEVGRDPAQITRSVQLAVSYDDPAAARNHLGRFIEAGFTHLVINLPSPYPPGVAQWVVDELISPLR
jgi:alkanesulfonate monooxygenase SsuD/methylene tetrahydromethanopterin reductase-like flavin-dependent oxidoreductase (luciferase family)